MSKTACHSCLFAFAVVAGLSAAGAEEKKDESGKTHTVKAQPLKIEVELEGMLEATNMRGVTFGGESWTDLLVQKAVDQGAKVSKGEPLIWLDTESIDEQIRDAEFTQRQTELSIEQAQYDVASLEKSVPLEMESAQRQQKVASEDLANFLKIDRAFNIKSAHFTAKSAQQYLDYAQEELNQLEKMYKEDDLTEETEEIILKRARQQMEYARFSVDMANVRRDRMLRFSIPRAEAEMKLQAAAAELALQKAKTTLPMALHRSRLELEKLKFQQKKSEQKLAELKKDRKAMVVHAPADGVVYYGSCVRGKWPAAQVMEQKLRAGGRIAPHEVVMTVVAQQPLFVRADIPEKYLHYFKPGVSGKVQATARPELKLSGIVNSISPVPVSEGTFDSHIALDGADRDSLVAGMTCKVKFVPYLKHSTLTVPKKAVFSDELDEEKKHVFVQTDDGKPEKRPVTVGKTAEDQTEILQGLKAGEKVLLSKPEVK